ncbi:MAG: C13 family peptidase [Burkholderiales bacterium]
MSFDSIGTEARLLCKGLLQNLSAGLRLALFMRVAPANFRVSAIHLLVLLAFNLLLSLCADYLFAGAAGELRQQALTTYLAQVALVLLASTLIAGILGRAELALQLPIMWNAADWLFETIYVAEAWLGVTSDPAMPHLLAVGLPIVLAIWPLAVMLRAVMIAGARGAWRFASAMVLAGALFWTLTNVIPRTELWRVPGDAEPAVASGIEREALFHRQPRLLAQALGRLAASRSDAAELYFLGVAPYASQDVFLREMRSAARILEKRFAIADRSVLLINNSATLDKFPMASTTNLRTALMRFGEQMDIHKDILLLFITTHGERNHDLAFDLPPLVLDPLRPADLAGMLDDSGVKWRVIVVSACFSGGFVDALKNPHTVVITAADARSTSFGCAHDNDWTYFGEAFFNEGMTRTPSFIDAFEIAREWVARRERSDGLDPSNPQLFVGDAIRARLGTLDHR